MNKIRSGRIQRILATIIILVIISLSFYFLSETISRYAGFLVFEEFRKESLADCLRSKNIFLFINTEDSTRVIKAVELGEYISYSTIFNCVRNSEVCSSLGITNFPTWIIDDTVLHGDITREKLIEVSGC